MATSAGAPGVERYGVFELTLRYPSGSLRNPWEDAAVSATFSAPSGKNIVVNGFYYDADTYKVRFVPTEIGTYTYTATIRGPTAAAPSAGSFSVVASARKGFAYPSTANPRRLAFDHGTLFNALGLQDCFGANPATGTTVGGRNLAIDVGQTVAADTYFATYAAAGFNLIRWGIDLCSFPIASAISTTGNVYRINQSKVGDDLLQVATKHGFHVMLDFFTSPPYPSATANSPELQAVERYIDYVIARYGAYTDVWELTNESVPQTVPDSWLALTADYVHQHDPYRRIVTNSVPRDGDTAYLDARSPHWYWDDSPLESDKRVADMLGPLRVPNRPIIVGETGNGECNWDATSALRMRLHLWSAFFNEAEVVFWNTAFKKNYCTPGSANIYLGTEERGYTSVLQRFTANVDPRVVMTRLAVANPAVRGWGLSSPTMVLGYFHHAADHTTAVTSSVSVDLPFDGLATWIDPATGQVLATARVGHGSPTLMTPPFTTDLALRVDAKT